jgi:vacuolar-type H+-ATPase subunit I/STV1
MDTSSLLQAFSSLAPVAASFQEISLEKVVSIGGSLIFVGVFILQFFSIYRHGGRDAIVSMLTWLLVACLCLAVAGYYWQQQRDFFQAVLLLCLAGGALSCFLVSLISRDTLKQEAERLKSEAMVMPNKSAEEANAAAAAIRERLAKARHRKEA